MSSLIAHLAAGVTAYACRSAREPRPFDGGLLAACAVLAVLPDLDYLLWWTAGIRVEPRLTHSLGFAAASAVLAWLALRLRSPARAYTAPGAAALSLLAAALSHELLDFLVGVHASPWLWPFTRETFVSPVGLLPSAGRLDFANVYLWRNLLIEIGVLGPALLALCAMRRPAWRLPRPVQFALAITAGISLSWSLSLPR
ncbi:metal-dependent hydrolase [Roseateles sp.]|uniref:metal-dependent hydrolase n=1 Tax=Roseateles sp. TaxID=1971397 RepID=UPI003266D060